MQLKFHTKTVTMLGMDSDFCADAISAIDQWESRNAKSVPLSVREWYSLRQCYVLNDPNKAFKIPSLDEFLDRLKQVQPESDSRITFIEPWKVNTGYEAWLLIDGTEDPLVVDINNWPLTGDSWRVVFSEYLCVLAENILETDWTSATRPR